jgi:hypothetical protein
VPDQTLHPATSASARAGATRTTRRSVVRAAAWAAPAVIVAAAAPPAAAASQVLTFTFVPKGECTVGGNPVSGHTYVYWQGFTISVSCGTPGAAVGEIRLAATFAPAASEPNQSRFLTANSIRPPSFPYASHITVGSTHERIEWVYENSASLIFDATGSALIDVPAWEQLRLENAATFQSGTYSVMAYEARDPANFALVTQYAFGG